MTKAFQTAQGIGVPEFRFKDNRRMQRFQETTLAGNAKLVRKIALDPRHNLEGYFVKLFHKNLLGPSRIIGIT